VKQAIKMIAGKTDLKSQGRFPIVHSPEADFARSAVRSYVATQLIRFTICKPDNKSGGNFLCTSFSSGFARRYSPDYNAHRLHFLQGKERRWHIFDGRHILLHFVRDVLRICLKESQNFSNRNFFHNATSAKRNRGT
jgi:hypothetical protein